MHTFFSKREVGTISPDSGEARESVVRVAGRELRTE